MLGDYEMGAFEMGAGAVAVLDPGTAPGFESTLAPDFRTATVPGVPRTFNVPASDRYADLAGRVGNIVVPSQLDFNIDWRAWLQGDVVVKSVWTNALGDRVDDSRVVEEDTTDPVDDPGAPVVTFNGVALTDRVGNPITYAVETVPDDEFDEDAGQLAEGEEVLDSGTISAGVTTIRYRIPGFSPVLLKNRVITARNRIDERTLVLRGTGISPSGSFEQDPGAVLDYRLDMSALLEPGERLYGTAFDMLAYGSRPYFALTPGMTFVSRTLLDKECIVWLSGGVVGATYLLTAGFNTSGGKTIYGQFAVTIKEK